MLWLLVVIRDKRTDPDVAIVAEDDASPTEKIMEMVLTSLHEGGRDGDQSTLG